MFRGRAFRGRALSDFRKLFFSFLCAAAAFAAFLFALEKTITGNTLSSILPEPIGERKTRPLYDVDGDSVEDILTFTNEADGPLWYSYTLGGVDGGAEKISSSRGDGVSFRGSDLSGLPVPGDFNGDGKLDLATFVADSSPGKNHNLHNWKIFFTKRFPVLPHSQTLEAATSIQTFNWGYENSVPVPADYDGDGITDLATYNPEQPRWDILFSSDGFDLLKANLEYKKSGRIVFFGKEKNIPVKGDFNGDGRDDLVLWDEQDSDGPTWRIYMLGGKKADKTQTFAFGERGDVPLSGDFDGDGQTEAAVYRARTGSWLIRFSKENVQEVFWSLNLKPEEHYYPLTGDFNGDGRSDLAFYKPEGFYKFYIRPINISEEALLSFPNGLGLLTSIQLPENIGLPISVYLREFYRRRAFP